MASIRETGVMKDPIHLRKKKDGRLHLILGAHRLEAARRLGWEQIEVRIWTDATDDWALLMEIDDNLAGAEMSYLDTAVFLAARKEVYERLHPEAKSKTGAALAAARWNAADIVSVASFASATAEKFGMTDRHVRRMIAAGATLGTDEIRHLRSAPRPVTLKDLTEIAQIAAPETRIAVVLRLASGNAKSASAARKSLLQESGALQAPVKDPVEDGFNALKKALDRAPKEALRRALEIHFDTIAPLVEEIAERRAPKVVPLRPETDQPAGFASRRPGRVS